MLRVVGSDDSQRAKSGRRWGRGAWRRVGLAALIALAYAVEVLFQPDVFTGFEPGPIVVAVATLFTQGFCAACAILVAVSLVERRREPVAWRYTSMLVLAVCAASAVGVLLWALVGHRGSLVDAVPYLAGVALRFALLGVFLALVDGFQRRLRLARARERELQMAQAALEAQSDLAQLRLLEAQIEPHFLFNTIANLRRTWRVDPALGGRMHDNVMRYLSASLPQMRAASSTLGAEVELTRAYLELFSLRMGSRLSFSIDLPNSLTTVCFPRMILVTLAENAIKHGLMPSDQGGTITIEAHTEAASLVISVVDDGVGFGAADTAGTGIGLANIRARLLTQYGGAARLSLSPAQGGGVVASLRVPMVEPARATSLDRTAAPTGKVDPARMGMAA
jgi:Histidine kinase